MRPALAATISTLDLSVGAAHAQMPVSVANYIGRPLYARATSDGTTLAITIDEAPGPDPIPVQAATRAEVSITVGKVGPVSYVFDPFPYPGNTKLQLKLRLNSGLTNATLYIRDWRDAPKTEYDLAFVLIESASPNEPRVRLEWITNPISIEDGNNRVDAQIVQPTVIPGSTLGPMGMSTP